MNRKQRRELQKHLRKENHLSKQAAKDYVNEYFLDYKYQKGDKVMLDYTKIERHPMWQKQDNHFKEWVIQHKDKVLTIDGIFSGGHDVTFAEDKNENKFKHRIETIKPVASAMIKLDNGETKEVILDGITSVDDPDINNKINKALEEM